jgi:transaldolase
MNSMNATQNLHDIGQSLWLDNITRGLLASGTLRRYRDEFAVTGLTSNPTIFDHALRHGTDYDAELRGKLKEAKSPEELFLALALTDLRQAADLFRPIHDRTNGVDGWVSLELSPLLAYDTAKSIAQAKRLHAEAGRPNFFIKIPGTPQGAAAIEETIFAGVPINVTLLFSREQYLAAAEAYLRGIERRLAAGLNPHVWSVASLFISRWDKAVLGKVPEALRDQLGIAIARRTYKAYRELLDSPRWLRFLNGGARPQRLCGPVRAPRTPKPPTCSTSRRWPPRSPSTQRPRRRCGRSLITAGSATCCRPMAGTVRRCWTASAGRASTSMPLAFNSSGMGPRSSISPGTICWSASRQKARP